MPSDTSGGAKASAREAGPPFRILVIDDEPMLRSIICEFIETLDGCEFAVADNGAEGLEVVRSEPIDCILSDIRMPRMDLEQLLDILKDERPEMVVIATSGFSDASSARQILERGAHEFIGKPMDLDQLERSLVWIPIRRRVLARAGQIADPDRKVSPEESAREVDELAAMLTHPGNPFAETMGHATRVARIAGSLADELDAADLRRLSLSALLHEIGASSSNADLRAEARSLRSAELDLVRYHAKIGARLIRHGLPDPLVGDIVEDHLRWKTARAADEPQWNSAERLGCLLGVLNVVDGMMSDRADRPAYSAAATLDQLERLYSKTSLTAVKQAIAHWDAISSAYNGAA